MQSTPVSTGDAAKSSQYDNLRDDAYAASTLRPHQQTTPGMSLYVENGAYYIGATRVLFAGGSTPTFTAPVSNPRIDLVTINSSGTLAIVEGTEGASPATPAYPSGVAVLCEVYHVVGETAIYTSNLSAYGWTSTQGYIQNDVRSVVAPVYISSSSQIKSGVCVLDPGGEGAGDLLYWNGSAWTTFHMYSSPSNILYLANLNGSMAWNQFVPETKAVVNSSWTMGTASGTQTIAHGFGTTPNKVRITAKYVQENGAYSTTSESVGTFDNTNQTNCVYSSFYQGTSATAGTTTFYIIYIIDSVTGTGSTQYATITVDATNVYLTWTKSTTSTSTNAINLLLEMS